MIFVENELSFQSMKINIIIVLFILFLFQSCEKASVIVNNDPNYPTVIKKLDQNLLTEYESLYYERNNTLISSLNQFGFCYDNPNGRPYDDSFSNNSTTHSAIIDLLNNFVQQNSIFTGVNNVNDLLYVNFDPFPGYNNSTFWSVLSSNQRIDTLEVRYTQIHFMIRNGKLVSCIGNWYPSIYIPKNLNIDQSIAKHILLNHKVSYSTIAGEVSYVKINSQDLNDCKINLIIFPIQTNDKIELHIAWRLDIRSVYYIIYIDAMSGNILSEETTIFS
jgi:hypothetical protein